ncbi:Isopenicillin N synthase [Parasponia andersonii]|uniref:Isopenicillin N synthase n=1 Tax=Parasponia andersonii TaxID=3476 RepID=A0A2P5C7D7_PARAD|nr:Isopenicillin N synthase [Parasponia andersonii]
MGEIDPTFIQDVDERPNLHTLPHLLDDEEIPIIDLLAPPNDVVGQIGRACENWGFFQVINHGVPTELMAKVEEVGRRFFELPAEEKRKVKRDEFNAMGYHDGENTKNVRDWKEVFDFLVEDLTLIPASHEPGDHELRTLTNQWPASPPEFREVCQEYVREVEKLAFKLLGLVAESLGLPENRLNGFFKGQTSLVRFNHYPPCPFPELALGVGRHKDAGALTILAQDAVGGLQVRRKTDQEWIPVRPNPNAFIINIGDIVQVWSNDKYESVEHRVVVNSVKERYSIPFFFFPRHDLLVKPFEEILNGESPRYRVYNWGKFFATRNRSDFKKQAVENIQIHHFRIEEK